MSSPEKISSEPLPSLLSELSSCHSDGDRIRTQTRFETQCRVLDEKLTHLVKLNRSDLYRVFDCTSQALDVVTESKQKCKTLKERLSTCLELLSCKRDDLRRLWVESLQHKRVHEMLKEISRLRKVPSIANELLRDKKYLEATKILVSSAEVLEGDLKDTEALKDLKAEIYRLTDTFYSIFLEELCQELYMSTFHLVFRGNNIAEEVTYEKVFKSRSLREASESINFNMEYVATLLECITSLKKAPETLEILKEECPNELLRIVHKLSKLMFDVIQQTTDTPLLELALHQQQELMMDLLHTIIGHFRQISINHRAFLEVLGKTVPPDVLSQYEMVDLYSNIQDVIEQFVSSYLEIQPMNTLPRQSSSVFSSSEIPDDLSSYFLPTYETKCNNALFKFSASSQGLIRNRKKAKYELLQGSDESGENYDARSMKLVLVCKPSVRNITLMFKPVKSFIEEIGSALELEGGHHCPLHVFLFDCTNHFLDQVSSEIKKIMENVSMCLESWSLSHYPEESDKIYSEKLILSSTLILYDYLKELRKLINLLPDFTNHFMQLVYYVILDYKDLLHKVFKSLFAEEQNILSVTWAKDRDIRRLLKSFSNWKHLEVDQSGEMVESPEEIRLRNMEESELLLRNLNSEEQTSMEIISDCTTLFHMALLEESLQWFSGQLLNFVEDFGPIRTDKTPKTQPSCDLKKLAKEYEDFSDVCLMALHLEVRAHCFQHLQPFSVPDRYPESDLPQELESSVQNLTNDLIRIDEALVSALTPKELKYVFEGLGELVASILVHNVSNMKRVSSFLVKGLHRSIFVLQCCLGNITMTREVSLERTRQYLQLLGQSCEDILNDIVEEGPKFKEQEYLALFRIIQEKEGDQVPGNWGDKLSKVFKRYSAVRVGK